MKSGNYEAPDSAVMSTLLLIFLPHVVNTHFVHRNLQYIFLSDGERQSPLSHKTQQNILFFLYLKL